MIDIIEPLREWALAHLGDGPMQVHGPPTSAGWSNDTLLFDVGQEPFVLRRPPAPGAFTLFPTYDLERQVRAMQLVREWTDVPVPTVRWYEPDASVLGRPFLVMERVDGEPAPDDPPYVFGSWLTEATAEQRARVEAEMVRVLAGIHSITDVTGFELGTDGDTALRRHVEHWRAYYRWVAENAGTAFPVIDAAFDWLERRWPKHESVPCLGWGDARLGNVLFSDFRAAAVLDWEAVAPGPCEVDLGWCLFFHPFFQRAAEREGCEGLPGFLEPGRFAAAYEAASGRKVRDLDWYMAYAEFRQAITSIRISARKVHRGEIDAPDDPQDLIMERDHLEEVIAGRRTRPPADPRRRTS